MTTEEAFAQLTSKRAWYKELGLTMANGNSISSKVRNGEYPSLGYMVDLLKKANYLVEQELSWADPKKID